LKATIIAVGKISEKYLQKGMDEYQKRLSPYMHVSVKEVKDEPLPNKLYQKEVDKVLEKEQDRIFQYMSPGDYVVLLDLEGREMTSEQFAQKLESLAVSGISDLVFVIGGTLGTGQKLKERADLSLSFSQFTFPHQLMRLILLEQLYRAVKINRGEPYHR